MLSSEFGQIMAAQMALMIAIGLDFGRNLAAVRSDSKSNRNAPRLKLESGAIPLARIAVDTIMTAITAVIAIAIRSDLDRNPIMIHLDLDSGQIMVGFRLDRSRVSVGPRSNSDRTVIEFRLDFE